MLIVDIIEIKTSDDFVKENYIIQCFHAIFSLISTVRNSVLQICQICTVCLCLKIRCDCVNVFEKNSMPLHYGPKNFTFLMPLPPVGLLEVLCFRVFHP